jgi:predicted GIY-YIG superfamily endonuclease
VNLSLQPDSRENALYIIACRYSHFYLGTTLEEERKVEAICLNGDSSVFSNTDDLEQIQLKFSFY